MFKMTLCYSKQFRVSHIIKKNAIQQISYADHQYNMLETEKLTF